jgi:hypothetical protein
LEEKYDQDGDKDEDESYKLGITSREREKIHGGRGTEEEGALEKHIYYYAGLEVLIAMVTKIKR